MALKLLQDGTKDAVSSAQPGVYPAVMNVLVKLRDVPIPKSTWKKLVQQMQVCKAAHSNCCGAASVGCLCPAAAVNGHCSDTIADEKSCR
jgi:hypothetical protein